VDVALDRLRANFAQAGIVQWIGLRTARDVPMREVDEAHAQMGAGLRGDRYSSASGKRGITLIQAEHLPVIASLCNRSELSPATLRRNVVVEFLYWH
jgi:MOSC domain-containing protein YiiM